MVYQIEYRRRAEKDLEKIDIITREQIIRKLDELSELEVIHPERMVSTGERYIRVGEYRIFIDITVLNSEILRIRHIIHRKKAYKR